MAEKNLIEIRISEEDGRYRRIFVTEKGRSLYRQMEKNGAHTGNRLLTGMSPEEKAAVFLSPFPWRWKIWRGDFKMVKRTVLYILGPESHRRGRGAQYPVCRGSGGVQLCHVCDFRDLFHVFRNGVHNLLSFVRPGPVHSLEESDAGLCSGDPSVLCLRNSDGCL